MTAPATYANPYWDAVHDKVRIDQWASFHPSGPVVGGINHMDESISRHEMVSRYAWTITSPETVAFVVEHAGIRVIDPIAGTGYWAFLLGQHGFDVAASDLDPPDIAKNIYHREGVVYVPVAAADGSDAVTVQGDDRTLLLSWPPYDEPAGAAILAAYRGDRLIFIGEGTGGCCGDDRMWSLIESDWVEVAGHRPVQWWGLHDYVTVYERAGVV